MDGGFVSVVLFNVHFYPRIGTDDVENHGSGLVPAAGRDGHESMVALMLAEGIDRAVLREDDFREAPVALFLAVEPVEEPLVEAVGRTRRRRGGGGRRQRVAMMDAVRGRRGGFHTPCPAASIADAAAACCQAEECRDSVAQTGFRCRKKVERRGIFWTKSE